MTVGSLLRWMWVGLILGVLSPGVGYSQKPRPSVLLITVDTLRADFVTTYHPQRGVTRYIDQIGQGGWIFTRAFSPVPLTLPAHASLLTGLMPVHHGVHDNMGFRLREDRLTMAEWLKRHGYATAAFVGAFPLDRRFGLDQGFDVYDDRYPARHPRKIFFAERQAREVIDAAIAWLSKQNGQSPWFVWIHLFDPHQPYKPPQPFRRGTTVQALYGGEVAYTDAEIGRLRDWLKRRGWWDQTLVVLTADHGESLGDHGENTHGYFAYNATLHVPLIIAGPGLTHRRINAYVSLEDVFPTVCGILGLPVPSGLDGRNLENAIRRGRPIPKRILYFESLGPFLNQNIAPIWGIIWRGMKFIDTPIPELYDLKRDFHETQNLAPQRDLTPFRKRLRTLTRAILPRRMVKETEETRVILRSLGYVSGDSWVPRKTKFTVRDDPKRHLSVYLTYMEGMELYGRGQVQAAIARMKDVITQRRDMISAYIQLVTMYRDIGALRQALLAAQAGLRVAPGHPGLTLQLAQVLMELGHLEEAIRTFRFLTRHRSEDPDVWNGLGTAYWQAKRLSSALQAFQRALTLDPTDPLIYNNLGNVYVSMKRYRKAEEAYRKALELDPTLVSAYNGYGAARLAQGAWSEALRIWRRALRIDPNHPLVLYNLGTELYKRGHRDEARVYLQRYLEVVRGQISSEEFQKIQRMLRMGNPP